MIRVESVTKSYGPDGSQTPVIADATFQIAAGDFCALTGASGSGKSTLLNLIGLLDNPTSGDIQLFGVNASTLNDDERSELRNKHIGFIFQSFHLLPRLSSQDNVALPLIYRGIPLSDRRRIAKEALERVGLGTRINFLPDQLSGGQRQRVAIARALVGRPSLLLADEPTGNLDSENANDVISLLLKLNSELGLTVIIVTHDPTISARAPRRIVMRDGRILDDNIRGFRQVKGLLPLRDKPVEAKLDL